MANVSEFRNFSLDEIKSFSEPLIKVLNAEQISYLIYGSVAKNIYKNFFYAQVRDLDIIVSEKDFDKILNTESLKENYHQITRTPFNIFFNAEDFEVGKIIKSISIDSFEHYQKDNDVDLNSFEIFDLNGLKVKLMKKDKLAELYEKYEKEDN